MYIISCPQYAWHLVLIRGCGRTVRGDVLSLHARGVSVRLPADRALSCERGTQVEVAHSARQAA